eukprot:COSAG01_NODE_26712_length_705_cov_1.018152_2_plen_170_part_01
MGGCYMISSHSRRASLSPHTPACTAHARCACCTLPWRNQPTRKSECCCTKIFLTGGERLARPTDDEVSIDPSDESQTESSQGESQYARVLARRDASDLSRNSSFLGGALCGARGWGQQPPSARDYAREPGAVAPARQTHRGRRAGMTDSAGKQQRRRRRPGRALGAPCLR